MHVCVSTCIVIFSLKQHIQPCVPDVQCLSFPLGILELCSYVSASLPSCFLEEVLCSASCPCCSPYPRITMATPTYVQVHICVGTYHGREDWEMLKMIKRMRICTGIQSVRVLLTSNWIASSAGLVYQKDGFHRYPPGQAADSTPVCKTRYPCYPKGIKERYADSKGSGKGAPQMNRRIQQRFYGLLARTSQEMQRSGAQRSSQEMQRSGLCAGRIWQDLEEETNWEVVLELNCERRVVAEATQKAMRLIEIQRGRLARCVYYRPCRSAGLHRLGSTPDQWVTHTYVCRLQRCCTVVTSFGGFAGMRVCLFERDEAVCIRELLVLLHRRKITGQAFWNVIMFVLGVGWNHITIRGYQAWTRILQRYWNFFHPEGDAQFILQCAWGQLN